MKVLITGATGFIGSHIIDKLLHYKDVYIIATTRNIEKAEKFYWFNHDNIKIIEFDISQTNSNIYSRLYNPDILIHLAWDGLPNYNNLYHIENNLYKNYLFLKDIISGGLQDLTVAGTCLEYGMKNGCLSENIDVNPIISYAIAKDSLRRFIEEFQKTKKFHLKWIRLFYIYGPNQYSNSILSKLDEAIKKNKKVFNMSAGEQLRDFLPVEKAVEYIIQIAFQNKITGIINCCSGKPISIRNLVENYLKEKNAHMDLNLGYYPYRNYEPMAFWGDNSKLNKLCNAHL